METNSKIKFSNAPNKDLVLLPKAGIRIVQGSAGAGSSGGNEKIANRRQQYRGKSEYLISKSETNSKIKFSNAPNKDLVLMPKAAIRIVQYSAGARSSGGNKMGPNRRQQQQKDGEFDFFQEFYVFFAKKTAF